MRVDILPATSGHMRELAANMREIDAVEYRAMLGDEPMALGLNRILRATKDCKAAFADGRLVCVYGVSAATLLSRVASPWLLATKEIERGAVRREFARRSKAEAGQVLSGYDRFENWCAAENFAVVRWLQWLGFSFTSETQDVRGVKFVKFWKDV